MAIIKNEITINAPIEKIWNALNNLGELDKYDPIVSTSTVLSEISKGIGASRKVTMKDGKNWFNEKCTVSKQYEALTYELTACSFPVKNLNHSYTFEKNGNQVTVKQLMKYEMKFGILGKLFDSIIMRKQSDKGIKLFLGGLKFYSEN